MRLFFLHFFFAHCTETHLLLLLSLLLQLYYINSQLSKMPMLVTKMQAKMLQVTNSKRSRQYKSRISRAINMTIR